MLEALGRRAGASAPLSSLDYVFARLRSRGRGPSPNEKMTYHLGVILAGARYYAAFSTASFSTATRAPSRAMV